MHDGEATYLFPRDDGILIGGIYQYGSWNLNIDPLQTADIIDRCAAVEPSVVNAPLLRQSVGLRPGREQVRLAVERLSPRCKLSFITMGMDPSAIPCPGAAPRMWRIWRFSWQKRMAKLHDPLRHLKGKRYDKR